MNTNKINVLETFYDSIVNKNMSVMLSCMHVNHPNKGKLEELYQPIFERFELAIDLLSLKVIGEDDTNVVIKDLVDTKELSGAPFKNNRTSTIHVLEKDNVDEWKILNSTMIKMEHI